jgi:hypothetical protein
MLGNKVLRQVLRSVKNDASSLDLYVETFTILQVATYWYSEMYEFLMGLACG